MRTEWRVSEFWLTAFSINTKSWLRSRPENISTSWKQTLLLAAFRTTTGRRLDLFRLRFHAVCSKLCVTDFVVHIYVTRLNLLLLEVKLLQTHKATTCCRLMIDLKAADTWPLSSLHLIPEAQINEHNWTLSEINEISLGSGVKWHEEDWVCLLIL